MLSEAQRDVLRRLAAGDTIRGVRDMLGETFEFMDAGNGVGRGVVVGLWAAGYIRSVPAAIPLPGLSYYDLTDAGRAALEAQGE